MNRALTRRFVLAAALIGLLASLVLLLRRGSSSSASPPAEPRVAVLDLDLVAGDSTVSYLATGIAEEINSALSRFDRLKIKSRSAVRSAGAAGLSDPIELGRSLRVDYLVEGSVRRVGESFRIAVRLTKASDGFQVWAHDFDTPSTLLPVLHEQIAREVAARLGTSSASKGAGSNRRIPTSDGKAYEAYLLANYYMSHRSPRVVERAIEQYRVAFARDTFFAAAKARVAYAYALLLDWGWPYQNKSPDALLNEGLALVDEAIAVDSSSTDAWMARAYLLEAADPVTMKGAATAFERALVFDPNNTEAMYQAAQVHQALGDWDAANALFRRAVALEPDRPVPYVAMASIAWKRGALGEARRLYDSALAVDPKSSYIFSARGLLRAFSGDLAGALQDARTAVQIEEGYSIPPHAVLAIALARSDSMSPARLEVERAIATLPNRGAPSATDGRFIAAALLGVNRRADALAFLERARPRGAWLWFYCLGPEFDAIRTDPRFQRIIREAHPTPATSQRSGERVKAQ